MTQASRTVTYRLTAVSSGVPGLQKFYEGLDRIHAAQARIKAQGDAFAAIQRQAAPAIASLTAAGRALSGLRSRDISIRLAVAGVMEANRDLNAIKLLLGDLKLNTAYRITVDVTALSAVNSQIHTQILQLQSLIAQWRALGAGPRPGPTPPAGGAGAGGSGGLPASVQTTLREVERLNNLWTRGQISVRNYEQALTAMQGRLRTAAAAATQGTAEFARIDAGITRITTSLRSVNTDAFQKLRTEAGAMRAAFDSATAGVARNSAEFRTASSAYSASSATIIARLQALASSGTLTTQQLGQVNRELQRLAREANTIAGGINHAGVSGSVVNSFGALGGQFGMVVTQGIAMVAMFKTIQATAGMTAVAMTALAGAGLVTGGALVGLGATGLKEVEKLQKGMNILQANGVQDLGAIEGKVKQLQVTLGSVGESFSQGDLMLAVADIVKAGVSADDALTLMASSTRLAASEQINLTDASALLLKNIRQYKGDVGDAAKVGDMLAKAGNLAAGNANDLSVGLGIVAGTGMQAKIEMYDLLGMLVKLDNEGMSAADVGANGLRSALAALADITVKGRGIMQGLGIDLKNVDGTARPAGDIMKDLGLKMADMGIKVDKTTGLLSGNGEALETIASIMDNRAAAALITLGDGWKVYGDQVKDSKDELINYSITMQQGVAPALNRVGKAFAEAGGEFVKTFAEPLAVFMTDTLTPLLKDIGSLFEKLQAMKKTGNIEIGLKFEANDTGTEKVLKLLGMPVQWGMAAAQVINTEELRLALIRGGILPKVVSPVAVAQQNAEVGRNYEKYLKLATELDAKVKAGIANPSGPLANQGGIAIDPNNGKTVGSLWTSGMIAGLKDVFISDPKVDSDCAIIASKILQTLGVKIAGSARASTLGQQVAAVSTKITKGEAQPGDFVDFSGPGYGAPGGSGHHSAVVVGKNAKGQLLVINNPGGSPGKDVPTVVEAFGLLPGGRADFYRPNVSPYARGNGPVQANAFAPPSVLSPAATAKPAAPAGLTADQIIQAQQLTAAIEKAQKAFDANPKDVGLTKALYAAQQAAETWGDKLKTNKEALALVASGQGKLNKASGEYVATQKDLQTYGAQALRLIKAQDAAIASGVASRRLAAETDLKNWEGTSKARGAVLQVEEAAYRTRQQAAEKASTEDEKAQKEADARAKTRLKNQQDLTQALAEERTGDAKRILETLKADQAEELALYADNAAKKAEIIKKTGPAIIAAQDRIANLTRDKAVQKAEDDANTAKGQDGADPAAIEATRLAAVRAAYKTAAAERDTARREQEAAERGEGRAAEAQAKARAKEQQQLRAAVANEARQLTKQQAEADLKRTVELNRQELAVSKATGAARLELIKRQAQDEYDAKARVAKVEYDQAMGEAARGRAQNRKAAEDLAKKNYDQALLEARGGQTATNQTAQEDFNTKAAAALQQQRQLNTLLRQGRVEDAQAVVEELKAEQARSLKNEKDTALGRLLIVNWMGPQIVAAQRRVALHVRDIAVKAAQDWEDTEAETAKKTLDGQALKDYLADLETERQARVARAYTTARNVITTAENEQADAVRDATAERVAAVDGFQKKYETLIDAFQKQSLSGELTDEDVTAFWADLSDVLGEVQKAGETLNPVIVRLRDQARGLANAAPGVLAAQANREDQGRVMDASEVRQNAAAQTAIDLATNFETLGNRAEAIQTLETALDGVMEAAGQGEVVGTAVSMLTDKIRELNASLDQGAVTRSEQYLQRIREEAEALALATEQAADASLDDRDYSDSNRVKTLANGGVYSMTRFLNGAGNAFFGERFWTDLGTTGRENFLSEFEKLTPEDFSKLGVTALKGMSDRIGDSAEWASVKEKVQAGLQLAIEGNSTDAGWKDFGSVLSQYGDLDTTAAGYADTLKTKLLPELQRQLGMATDPKLKQAISDTITGLTDQAEAADQAATALQNAREAAAMGQLERSKAAGRVSEGEYIDQRTGLRASQEISRFTRESKDLKGDAFLAAEKQYQETLTQIYDEGDRARQALTWRIQDETRQVNRQSESADLEFRHELGLVSEQGYLDERGAQAEQAARDEFASRTRGMKVGSDEYKAAEAKLQADLVALGQQGARDRVQLAKTEAQARQQVWNSPAQLANLVSVDPREFDDRYREEIENLNVLKGLYPQYGAQIDKVIAKSKILKGLNVGNGFLNDAKMIAGAIGQIASAFGNDDLSQAMSDAGRGFESAQSALVGIGKVALNPADIGGWIQAITGVVGAVDGIGSAILNLNPAFRQWKKNLLEIADAQKSAMGSKQLNGWLDNPYYEALKEDAGKRDQLANAKIWQRIAWGLFGGAPQVMSDEAAKAQIKAATLFNDFGQELAGSMESALLDGFDAGDFSKVNDKLDQQLDRFMARMLIQTIFAKSKIKELLQAYSEEAARGGDTSDEIAALKAERDRVVGEAESALTVFDGFGAGSDSSGGSSGTTAGTPAAGANFYIANSTKIDLFDQAVTRMDELLLRHSTDLNQHSTAMNRHSTALDRNSDLSERLLRDGIALIDAQGNYRGAFR